jgi:hypothetical protein
VSIRKIQCFLSVLFLEKASESHTRVSECKGLRLDTSMFDLANTTTVNKSDVATLGNMSSKPGDASWQTFEYAGLDNVKQVTHCASVSHACNANEYVLTHRCETCAPGKVNIGGDDAVGNNTNCTAILCMENQHVVSHVCTTCAAGMINNAGDDASGADTSCKAMICGAGQHVKSHACHTCPNGTKNPLGGHDASKGDTSCVEVKCLENQYVKSHACHTCSPGTTNAAGDDASSKDTVCDITKCKINQKVVGNACQGCPPGKTNAAGDKASGNNTKCDSVTCETNQHVVGHACAACPDGMERPRGDDASGQDTVCAAIKCKANQRVVSHACFSCPSGQTNAAGDDASKSDTSCDESVADSRQIIEGVGQLSSVRRRHTGSAYLLSCPAGKKPVSCGFNNWRGGRRYEQGLTAVTTEGCWSRSSLSKRVVCVADKFTMSLNSASASATCPSGMVVSGCMASTGIAVARAGAYPRQTTCHCKSGAQCSAHCIQQQNAPGYEIKTSGACPAGKKVLGCGMHSGAGTESSPTLEADSSSESCSCYNFFGATCYSICVDR